MYVFNVLKLSLYEFYSHKDEESFGIIFSSTDQGNAVDYFLNEVYKYIHFTQNNRDEFFIENLNQSIESTDLQQKLNFIKNSVMISHPIYFKNGILQITYDDDNVIALRLQEILVD